MQSLFSCTSPIGRRWKDVVESMEPCFLIFKLCLVLRDRGRKKEGRRIISCYSQKGRQKMRIFEGHVRCLSDGIEFESRITNRIAWASRSPDQTCCCAYICHSILGCRIKGQFIHTPHISYVTTRNIGRPDHVIKTTQRDKLPATNSFS